MTQKQVPPKPAPTTVAMSLLIETANSLIDGGWLKGKIDVGDIPGSVVQLIRHHTSLRKELDEIKHMLCDIPRPFHEDESRATSDKISALLGRWNAAQAEIDSATTTTPQAIQHLQDILAGTSATLVIDDSAQNVTLEYLSTDIPVAPHQMNEALDAISTLQCLIEGVA
jgi:hypothetical protein